MSATQTTLEGTSEPWKDADTLRELYDGRTQSEVAEWFQEKGHDVTASTISYWMNKLEVNTSHTKHKETEEVDTRRCDYYEACGNETCGPRNLVCRNCLDVVRQRTSEGFTPREFEEEVLDGEFTTITNHIRHLYERYND